MARCLLQVGMVRPGDMAKGMTGFDRRGPPERSPRSLHSRPRARSPSSSPSRSRCDLHRQGVLIHLN